MTNSRDLAGADGHCSDLRKPEGLFREVAGVEAAKLPEPCHLDRTRAVCIFRAVAALAACGSSLPLASLHNASLCKAGPAGLPAGRDGEAQCKGLSLINAFIRQ